MKTTRILCAIAILALVMSACSSSGSGSDDEDGVYSNKILPSTLAIKLPASLAAAASASTSIVAKPSIQQGISFAVSYDEDSAGYYQVKSAVETMSAMGPTLVLFGIVVDAVISQNDLGAGSYASEKVTLTKAMYNAMVAQLPAGDAPDPDFIGSSITLTNIVYSTSGGAPFQNSFSFTSTEGGESFSPKYEWSSDRTKLRMSETSTYAMITQTFAITYDTTTKSCAFKTEGGGTTYQLAVQGDAANAAKNGVYVYESYSGSIMTTTYSGTVYGYADDDGGLVLSSYTGSSGGPSWSYQYTEGFNGSGALLYAQYQYNSGSLTDVPGYTDTAPVTTYGARAAGAGSASTYGAIALL